MRLVLVTALGGALVGCGGDDSGATPAVEGGAVGTGGGAGAAGGTGQPDAAMEDTAARGVDASIGPDASLLPDAFEDAATRGDADSARTIDANLGADARDASLVSDAPVLSDRGDSADGGLGDPSACSACEGTFPSDSTCIDARAHCLAAEGSAVQGPKAGAPKALLCRELLSCIWRTGCNATGDSTNCFCGTTTDCFHSDTPPQGACKNEIYAAAESTDIDQVDNRLYDLTFASGLAIQVTDCDSIFCGFECGFCTLLAGSGPSGDLACHPAYPAADAGAEASTVADASHAVDGSDAADASRAPDASDAPYAQDSASDGSDQ